MIRVSGEHERESQPRIEARDEGVRHEVKGAQGDAEGDHARHDDPRGGREALVPAQGTFGSLSKGGEITLHDTGEDEAGEESQAPDEPEDAHEDIRLAGPVHEANAQDIDPSDEPE